MADKHFIRRSLDQVGDKIRSLHNVKPDERDPMWKAERDVLYAEIGQLLELALPPASPLLALFKKSAEEASATSSGAPATNVYSVSANADPIYVVMRILAAAHRWNETRVEEEATAGLAEDVNRILSRNLLKYPVVQMALAVLVAAAGFAIFGVIQFQGMKIDVKEEINKKGDAAMADIQARKDDVLQTVKKLQEQVGGAAAAATKLDGDITAAKQRVSDLTMSAVRDLTAQKVGAIEAAAASATIAVEGTSRQAVEKIKNATDVEQLRVATEIARRSIESNAKQYVEDVKSRVAPAFDNAIKQDANTLQDLNRRLAKADSRLVMVDAALRAMGMPGNKLVNNLAGYFNETVLTVYIVLGLSLFMFLVNLAMMLALLRQRVRGPIAG